MKWDGEVCAETATWTRRARNERGGRGPASRRPPAPTGLTSEERARREGGALKAAGGEWGTTERAGRKQSQRGKHHTAGPSAGSPPGRGQRCEVTGRARGPGGPW